MLPGIYALDNDPSWNSDSVQFSSNEWKVRKKIHFFSWSLCLLLHLLCYILKCQKHSCETKFITNFLSLVTFARQWKKLSKTISPFRNEFLLNVKDTKTRGQFLSESQGKINFHEASNALSSTFVLQDFIMTLFAKSVLVGKRCKLKFLYLRQLHDNLSHYFFR